MFRRLTLAVALLLCACGGDDAPADDDPCKPAVESVPTPPLSTPRWAFEPWISKDISTADDTRAFVQGFRERDIPVGAVVLDSPWETHYNTFVPNPNRYPNFGELVQELHDDQIRVVLWVTQMVNVGSYDFEPGGDDYVTRKALDGVFYMVGQEEKQIRTNPAARTTDLLKTVFGK